MSNPLEQENTSPGLQGALIKIKAILSVFNSCTHIWLGACHGSDGLINSEICRNIEVTQVDVAYIHKCIHKILIKVQVKATHHWHAVGGWQASHPWSRNEQQIKHLINTTTLMSSSMV